MLRILTVALAALITTSVAQAEQPLETATVKLQERPRLHHLDGAIEAVHQGTISAQTQGQVAEILYDVDDYVEAGAIVIRLKDREQQAQATRAEAALKEAAARLEEARKEQTRIKGIFAKKLVSRAAMDKADAALKAAVARQESAQAGLEQAQEQLEYTRVRAPYAGIVTERHVEVGEIARPGQKLISGISLEKLRVTADVPQSLIPAIRTYDQGSVQLPSGVWINAEKITIFPFAHEGSNTFKVRLQLPAGIQHLFPGMYVKTAFVVGRHKELLIPQQAVVYRSEVTGAYVLGTDGRVSLRHIRVGSKSRDGMLQVLAGLDNGEQVAVDPIAAGVELKKQLAGQPDE
jgi:RND family efflux transporter MFP subunit